MFNFPITYLQSHLGFWSCSPSLEVHVSCKLLSSDQHLGSSRCAILGLSCPLRNVSPQFLSSEIEDTWSICTIIDVCTIIDRYLQCSITILSQENLSQNLVCPLSIVHFLFFLDLFSLINGMYVNRTHWRWNVALHVPFRHPNIEVVSQPYLTKIYGSQM